MENNDDDDLSYPCSIMLVVRLEDINDLAATKRFISATLHQAWETTFRGVLIPP